MAKVMQYPVGQRVRFNEKCVWPERIGHEGVIVAPPTDGTYPQPAKWEVIVLLDDDPLEGARHHERPWSCVTQWASLDAL